MKSKVPENVFSGSVGLKKQLPVRVVCLFCKIHVNSRFLEDECDESGQNQDTLIWIKEEN